MYFSIISELNIAFVAFIIKDKLTIFHCGISDASWRFGQITTFWYGGNIKANKLLAMWCLCAL